MGEGYLKKARITDINWRQLIILKSLLLRGKINFSTMAANYDWIDKSLLKVYLMTK